ncbi:hypothetical protein LOD99_2037 [Oopsacas minuta]|uniref:Tyrosine specific protein phosphatases domain-containing protein n=1 Tax=Oopsacas minuta TaxID=111878 RepID=A0AAV7K434_9METZ|nr:hypothetical protein LOD99_2037 [Oopsacas minuta]
MNYQFESEFPKLANFRCLEGFECSDGSRVKTSLLYRSARPDIMTVEECERFNKFRINSIIDFRRKDEYVNAPGAKHISKSYPSYYWKKGEFLPLKKKKKPITNLPDRKHLIISLFSMAIIWNTLYMVNFFIRWPSLILALIDKIFGTRIFVKFYAKLVVNHTSLADQYFEILENTKPIIFVVLNTLTDEKNLPALIQCSQGKDRTGVIAMLILSILGVKDEDIIEDYAKSEKGLVAMRVHTVKEICGMYGFKDAFTHARPDTMIDLLQSVRQKYGSVMLFLDEIGFDETHRDKMRLLFTQS